MPFDPISYMLAKKKLNKKDYKLSTLPIDTDLDMGGFKITDLGEPVNPNDAPTRRYVDVATTGLGINFYFLDAADTEVPAYKQLSLTPPELAEAYVEYTTNAAGDYEIGSWIAPADVVPVLRLGVYTTHFQAERIGGNIDVRFFFRLYERDTLGTETLIAESSLSDIVTDRRDVVTSLILASDHVMAAGSRLVLKIFVRFLSSGASTTVRLYYQGAVRSRLATPIAKEVLDTIYAAKLHASTHLKGGSDEVLNLTNINNAIGFSIDSHESRHEYGGDDEIPSNDIVKRFVKVKTAYWFCDTWHSGILIESVSGSGSISYGIHYITLSTGMTADSYASVYRLLANNIQSLDWDKVMYFAVRVVLRTNTAQNIHIVWGDAPTSGSTNTNPHIGFKAVNDTLYGTAGDGTAESELSLMTFNPNVGLFLEAILYPDDKVEFYINGGYYGEITTNLPTVGAGRGTRVLTASIHNTEAADKYFHLQRVRVFAEEM
ncbi:MAG: hypothetical protein ACXQTW_03860 [Candidatus Methanospirareceae archaeon]